MLSKTFRRIAASTVALASLLSASTAFAERDWDRTTAWTISGPVASVSRDTGSVSQVPVSRNTGSALQAPASAAPSGMSSDRDLTGRTSTTSVTSVSSSNFYGTLANPYEGNPTAGGSGGH